MHVCSRLDLFGAVTDRVQCGERRKKNNTKGSTVRDVSPVIIERVSICRLPDCMSNEHLRGFNFSFCFFLDSIL